jgi:hypothetical protein
MPHLPALRLADRQRLDVGVVIGDLEPTELAVTTAGTSSPPAPALIGARFGRLVLAGFTPPVAGFGHVSV